MHLIALALCIATARGSGSQLSGQIDPFKPNYPTGALAMDRLGPEGVRILKGARRVEVELKRWERATDHISYGDGLIPLAQMRDRDAGFAARIVSLLFEDEPYTLDHGASIDIGEPVFVLRFWNDKDEARLEIVPGSHMFRFHFRDKGKEYWLMASGDLRPIYGRMLPFLRTAFAGSDAIRFLPLPPEAGRPGRADVPAAILKRITVLKPGMRRSDVLDLFDEMGGISTRGQRTYVLKEQVPGTNKRVLVTIEFAAPKQKVLWLEGRGYLLLRDNPWPTGISESPDDVIIRIRTPQLDYPFYD